MISATAEKFSHNHSNISSVCWMPIAIDALNMSSLSDDKAGSYAPTVVVYEDTSTHDTLFFDTIHIRFLLPVFMEHFSKSSEAK